MKTYQPGKLLLISLLALSFLLPSLVWAQSETHDLTTYDTVYVNSGITWTLRITRPVNLFTQGHPDTASRPVIISMPGVGEVGTDPSYLVKYGPHYWMQNGWDGGVQLSNGKHYPIIITIITSATNVRPVYLLTLMNYLLDNYHIKRNSVHVAGLSMGGFTWGRFICYAAYAGDERAMSLIKSYTSLEGVANDNFTGYDLPGWTPFGRWAKQYGGKFFGLEGTNDTRNVWNVRDAMQDSVPNSAYFSYQTIGGGAHCCWNSMYDPSVTDWQCVSPITNSNIGINTNHPNGMGTYFKGENIFQWMLRQGDTTMVGSTSSTGAAPTVSAGTGKTIQLPTSSVTLTGTATANGTNTISTTKWSQLSGPAATITSPNALSTTVTGLNAGTYVFSLTATDNIGQSTSASVTVTVVAAATPPNVSAGSTQTITLPSNSITLNGSASGNSGAAIVSYTWSLVSGPNSPSIAKPDSVNTTVSNLVAGTYVFQLRVTDSNNQSDSSTVQVVVNSAPAPPTGSGVQVGLGEYQAFFLDKDRHLWGLGRVASIGVNNTGKVALPQRVQVTPSNLTFQSVAGGLHGGAAVDDNGYVWTMGANDQGQLGIGNLNTTYLPQQITVDSAGRPFNNVKTVVAYFVMNQNNGFLALKNDGTLWIWGRATGGMRGNGTDNTLADSLALRPVQIVMPGNRQVKQILAGTFALALCTDGTVWTWGPAPSVNLGYTMSGTQYRTPHQLTQVSNITQIAGGGGFNYALASNNALYGWGQYGNYMGNSSVGNTALYVPTLLSNITNNIPAPISKIVTNSVATYAILTDGSLWAWGDGAQGNIGNGQELDFSNPANGLYAWTFATAQLLIRYPYNIAPTIKFADVWGSNVFTFYTYAKDANGQLYCWGRNKASVLANGIVSGGSALDATYANAWDVKWPQKVDPFALAAAGQTWISTCPYCIVNPSGTSCSTYPIPANTRPVSNAGNNQNITSSTTTLDGSGSTDNVHISYYEWKQLSGPNTAIIDLPGNAVAHVYGLVSGTYRFQLRVIDNGWLSDSTFIDVAVNAGTNKSPIAVAGPKQTISLPTNIATLDGSKSSDPDGLISKYAWTMVSGPITPTIANLGAAVTTVSGFNAGTYIFKLTVTDNQGATASAYDTIVVNSLVNQPPVANAGADLVITLPTNSATLNGSASQDPNGDIASYSWIQTSGPSTVTISSGNTSTATASNLIAGVYVFRLTVTDNGGLTSTDSVKITVLANTNKPPVANAGSSKTIILPTNSVALDGTGSSDADGSISTYKWTQVSGPSTATLSNANTATATAGNLVAGQYVFQLTVTDNLGATGTAQVKVTVAAASNKPPVANAGTAITITLPTSSSALNGSASSDPDGTIASYSWIQVSGPSTATISNANTATATAGGMIAGQYIFQLTVTDNSGATASAQVKITVLPAANQAPVANAGAAKSITLPVNTVSLDGSASTDPDGYIASYAWTQLSGPSTATLQNSNQASATATDLQAGQYIFQLTVTDNLGATGTAQVKVTVSSATSSGPTANAGSNLTITLPVNSVTLDGSNSIDPGGTIQTYAWTQVSGPVPANIVNPGSSLTTVNALIAGTFTFQLTVTDNNGLSATDQITVVVNPATNKPPVANAGNNITITLPVNTAVLDGSSSTDPDGTISTYAWTILSGPGSATISNSSASSTSMNNLVAGTYVVQLTVTDNSGATAKDVISVNVVVQAVNQAPIANAGANTTINLPTNSVTLDASASADPDGTISSYSWTQVSGPSTAVIANAGSVSTQVSSLVAGSYVFRVTVTDNLGSTSTDQVTITVNANTNKPPVANAGAGQVISLPTSTATLDGSKSSDPDGTIVSYSWTQVSGPATATINNGSAATTTVSGLTQAGQYVFRLIVTDNQDASAQADVKISVNAAANIAPVANAGDDQTIQLPVEYADLDGSRSYDPDGSIVAYTWSLLSGPTSVATSSSNSPFLELNDLAAGTYVLQLTVTDNKGATGTDRVTITVSNNGSSPGGNQNQAPVANAGLDSTIALTTGGLTLDGSASFDPDGTITSYSWTQISGPSIATFADPTISQAGVSGLQEGVYVFMLTVTDNAGAIGIDSVRITVVENTRFEEQINLFPNPTTDILNIKLMNDHTGSVSIKIFDLNGRLVMAKQSEKTGAAFNETMNVSGLTRATYIIQVIPGPGQSPITRKFIKQ